MSTQYIYMRSELSLAAYATLNNSALSGQKSSLINAGFSDPKSDKFANLYAVISQFTDGTTEGGMDTSFSATVFKDDTDNLSIGFRGTLEFFEDIDDGEDILIHGVAYEQVVAMYNWWKRASSPEGQNVPQFAIEILPEGDDAVPPDAVLLYTDQRVMSGSPDVVTAGHYLVETDQAVASGELSSALAEDSDLKLSLTGHSLGGHLRGKSDRLGKVTDLFFKK